MIDRIIATISLLMFLTFLGFLAVYIGAINLWGVILLVGAMATFDFIRTLRQDAEAAGADGLSAHDRAVQTLENQDQAG